MFEGNHRLGILAVGAYFVIGLRCSRESMSSAEARGAAGRLRYTLRWPVVSI
jgi:hypothetical protein